MRGGDPRTPGGSGPSRSPRNVPLRRPAAPPTATASGKRLGRIQARRDRTRALLILVSVLVVFGLYLFVSLVIVKGAAERPELGFLQTGTLEKTDTATALLIRDETVYSTTSKGTIRPMADEGSKVPAQGLLAYVTPKDGMTLLADLQDVEQQIADLQRSLLLEGKGQAARAIYDESDQNLSVLADLMRRAAVRSDLSGTARISSSIGIVLERRNSALSTIDFNDGRLDLLIAKKGTLETSLGQVSASIVAQRPGIVSYEIDGLEKILDSTSISTLTAAKLAEYLAMAPVRFDPSREVESGTPVLRTIDGPYQYLAFLMKGMDSSSFPNDSLLKVRFPLEGTDTILTRVVRSENSVDGLILILKTDQYLERFSDRRTEDADIVRETDTGLKVSVSSFVSYDQAKGTAVLKIVTGGYVRLADVRVVAADRDEAIVESLPDSEYKVEQYGILVLHPDSIQVGEYIQ